MTSDASRGKADFAELFDKRAKDVLSLEANRVRVGELAYENYKKCFGCAQSMFQAFQDVLEIKDEFWFKAMGGLQGGGGCGLTCGALSMGFVLINARSRAGQHRPGLGGYPPALRTLPPVDPLVQAYVQEHRLLGNHRRQLV
jgi:hypothetical protein